MKGLKAALAAGVALGCVGLAAALAETGPKGTLPDGGAPLDRLIGAYYAPLADLNAGRLYEPSADLLAAARELPKAVDLGVELPGGQEDGAEAPQAPAAQPPVPPAERKWLAVLDHAVVGQEELAHAQLLAGSFQEAAALYRELRTQDPDDEHLLLMLLLCERNAGNVAEAEKLLVEVQKKGGEAAKWGEWVSEMMKLNAASAKEVR